MSEEAIPNAETEKSAPELVIIDTGCANLSSDRKSVV